MMVAGLLPVVDDRDTGGFFEAARRGVLAVRRCSGCDAVLHMPRAYCKRCGSWEGRWDEVAGTGRVYAWTVVEHQVHPSYPVPYTVILVELDDDSSVRFVGHLDGDVALEPGQPDEVWFEDIGDGDKLPQWRLR
jgi:uncharacterized OB-fold protein